MSNPNITATIPFKSELDLARSQPHSVTISLPVALNNEATHRDGHNAVHSVLSTDIHNTRASSPTALKGNAAPVAIPNLTKKARGRQVPTTKETLLKPGTSGRSYACKVENCRKVFTRSEHLKRHIRSIHTNERPFQCEEPDCGKFFTRHDNLLQHRRSHRGQTSTTTTESFSRPSGTGPNDALGPFSRIYTGSGLTWDHHGTARNSESSSASTPSSMGILLPSPLTTTPAPSLYARIAIDATGYRSPPTLHTDNSAPNMSPSNESQVYHRSPPSRHAHGRRDSGSISDFVHAAADGGPATPTSVSASSPTSATSASPFTMNYAYTSTTEDGRSLSPPGPPAYLSAVSCYWEENPSAHLRTYPNFGAHHAHYADGGLPISAQYQQASPFTHVSVPMHEVLDRGGSIFPTQWRV